MDSKVLVIDDDDAILKLIAHKLRNSFKFICVTRGKAAIDVLRNEKVSLILMDQMMPDIDGMETFNLIKGVMALPPPAIMMTAYTNSELLLSFMKNGGADFIAKPLDFDILEIKMRRAIAAGQAIIERKMMEKALARQERLASIGILSDGISHEILNPLNVIGTTVQLMQLGVRPEEIDGHLKIILTQIDRIAGIINTVRAYAHPRHPEESSVNIHKTLDRVIANMAYPFNQGVIVKDYDSASPPIFGSEEEIGQVFKHIFQNAADAIMGKADGLIHITTRASGNNVVITIKDNGSGIARENIDKIFDPFYTTKDVGQGLGLGLSVSCSIVRNHGGTINVESEVGGGTSFKITFPISQ